jgi:hypothetical protein
MTGITEEWHAQVAAIREAMGRWLDPLPRREPGAGLRDALVRELIGRFGAAAAPALLGQITTPPRGLHVLGRWLDGEGRLVLRLLCDCGRPAELALRPCDPEGNPVPFSAAQVRQQELAFTCGGCGSHHWLTVGPP